MAKVIINGHFIIWLSFAMGVMADNREASYIVENVRNGVKDTMIGQNFLEPATQDSDGGSRIEEQSQLSLSL